MKYALVATPRYLLSVDLVTKHATVLEGNRPEYYGMTWFPNSDDLILTHSGLDNQKVIDLESYAQSEVGWISAGNKESGKFLSAPHQMVSAPDDKIICTNTGRNSIVVVDLKKPNIYQEARISEARWDRLDLVSAIGDHLNSVFLKDKQLYVIAHRFNKGSMLGVFSYPELELTNVESVGTRTGLHNIWVTDEGQRISCHSESGSLVDIDSDIPLWESGVMIYTRGLAAGKDYIIIGESQRGNREDRRTSISGLWILDRQSFKALDYICLGPFGAVNEVRLLDVPDEAHHGATFRGLESLLARDMRTEIRDARLSRAELKYQIRHRWSDYEQVFGTPEAQTDGGLFAGPDNLCLVIRRPEVASNSITFHYEFKNAEPGEHVSAVMGYHGSGDDTRMTALLIQRSGPTAELGVWIHDGSAWSPSETIDRVSVPVMGNFCLSIRQGKALVIIDDQEVLEIEGTRLGLADCSAGLGIRWIGATIRVSEAENA